MGFEALTRSIPSLLTCISSLLPAERIERQVLQTCDLGLEEAQVDQRRAAVVLTLDVPHAGTVDQEDRHAPAVHAPELDLPKLAAAHETEGAQEQVVRLKHWHLPRVKAPAPHSRSGGLHMGSKSSP